MSLQTWVANHPHLEELARLHQHLDVAANLYVRPDEVGQTHRSATTTDLPLLLHRSLDHAQAGEVLRQILEVMPAEGLPAQFSEQCAVLRDRLRQSPDEAVRLIDEAVGVNLCVRPDADGQAQEPAPCIMRLRWISIIHLDRRRVGCRFAP